MSQVTGRFPRVPPRPSPRPAPAALAPIPEHEPATPQRVPLTLDDVAALVEKAIVVGEVAAANGLRAGATASECRTQLAEITRSAPDSQGRPGVLYWLVGEVQGLRAVHAPRRTYAMAGAVAAAVALGTVLLLHAVGV